MCFILTIHVNALTVPTLICFTIIGGVKCSTEFHFEGYQCTKDSALQVCNISLMWQYYIPRYSIPDPHSSGLYPQLALPDDCNSYRRDSEQVFHTKVKYPICTYPYIARNNCIQSTKSGERYAKLLK